MLVSKKLTKNLMISVLIFMKYNSNLMISMLIFKKYIRKFNKYINIWEVSLTCLALDTKTTFWACNINQNPILSPCTKFELDWLLIN